MVGCTLYTILDFGERFKLEISWKWKSCQPLDGLYLPHGLDEVVKATSADMKGSFKIESCSSST